jgi:hypothetical protein
MVLRVLFALGATVMSATLRHGAPFLLSISPFNLRRLVPSLSLPVRSQTRDPRL